jgi:hypothetical protein
MKSREPRRQALAWKGSRQTGYMYEAALNRTFMAVSTIKLDLKLELRVHALYNIHGTQLIRGQCNTYYFTKQRFEIQ